MGTMSEKGISIGLIVLFNSYLAVNSWRLLVVQLLSSKWRLGARSKLFKSAARRSQLHRPVQLVEFAK